MSNPISSYKKSVRRLFGENHLHDFRDKSASSCININYMLNRTAQMFDWQGLPDSIPARILELYLQLNGNACFYNPPGDNLYIFTGGLGGEPDVYYRPTIYTISNPALNLSANLKIDEDCIVMPNDTSYLGLLPLFKRYATLLTETELSMQISIIMSRLPSIISAANDNDVKAGKKYIDDLIDGKLGIYPTTPLLDSLHTQPMANTAIHSLTDLIEMQQYLKASWYNDIGLDANYNMKREQLSVAESQMNSDALIPLVDDMLTCRQTYAEKVNDMFGTNISVTLKSVWKAEREKIDVASNQLDNTSNEITETNVDIYEEGE